MDNDTGYLLATGSIYDSPAKIGFPFYEDMTREMNNSTLYASLAPKREMSTSDKVFWSLNLYLTPVIIVVGLSGNILSLIVFICTRLRHLSSSVYLAALCIADSAFLIQLFAVWLNYVRVFIYHINGLCQTFIYVMFVSSFLSVWFVVCFTLERYIVCIYPLKKRYICNVRRAKIIVISISVFAAVFYSYGAWTTGVNENNTCMPKTRYESFQQIMGNIDTVITLLIPSVLIIFMNARIVVKLAQSSQLRTKMIMQQNGGGQLTPLSEQSKTASFSAKCRDMTSKKGGSSFIVRSQLKTTKMLVTVSTIFVMLNAPNHLIRMYITMKALFATDEPSHVSAWLWYWQQISNFIYYINFSINLFLYSLCGQNFRIALKSLFIRAARKGGPYASEQSSVFKAVFHNRYNTDIVSSQSQNSECEVLAKPVMLRSVSCQSKDM